MGRVNDMNGKTAPTLTRRLQQALGEPTDVGLRHVEDVEADDERDELLALWSIHDLYLAPLDTAGPAVRWQHHPTVASLKHRVESNLLASFAASTIEPPVTIDPKAQIRGIAASGRMVPVYEWVAQDSSREDLRNFLALEGGPDDGFDDLVACCQIGLAGDPKLEMARNYWDEMGRGDATQVHRALHRDLTVSLGVPRIPREALPRAALRRGLLTSTLATNRSLQPELIGVLGMIELQAGARCRHVVRGLDRLGATAKAVPFYEVHATTDPRHGKGWLDHVVGPLAHHPLFGPGMVRGAQWRAQVDHAFFTLLWKLFVGRERSAA